MFAVAPALNTHLKTHPSPDFSAHTPTLQREGDRNLERVVEAATKYLSGQYAKLETTLGDATSNMRQRGVVINARLQELAAEETRIHEERRRLTEENAHLQQLIASNEKETEAIRDQVGDIGALLTGLNDTLLPQEGNLRPPRESSAVSVWPEGGGWEEGRKILRNAHTHTHSIRPSSSCVTTDPSAERGRRRTRTRTDVPRTTGTTVTTVTGSRCCRGGRRAGTRTRTSLSAAGAARL